MAGLRSWAIKGKMNIQLLTWTYGVTSDRINSYDVGCFMVFPKDF